MELLIDNSSETGILQSSSSILTRFLQGLLMQVLKVKVHFVVVLHLDLVLIDLGRVGKIRIVEVLGLLDCRGFRLGSWL